MKLIVDLVRAGRTETRTVEVPESGTVRDALRATGLFAEGSAVLLDGQAVPLDHPVAGLVRLEVVPTFSGG